MSRFGRSGRRQSVADAVGPLGFATSPKLCRRKAAPPNFAEDQDPRGMIPAARVADLFGVQLRTLWNWEKAETLIPIRINGRRYYRISDIEKRQGGCGG